MTQVRLVVFDVMGTIIEDHGQVADAFSSALTQNGFNVSVEKIKEIKGAGKREAIRKLISHEQAGGAPVSDAVIDSVYTDFQRHLEAKYSDGSAIPIPGVSESLRWLLAHGIAVAATTGFYRKVTDLLIESVGWSHSFGTIVCSDDVRSGRPAPYMIFRCMEVLSVQSVHEVINVGDTPLDIQAGNNAGVAASLGVLTGVHTEARLSQEKPTALIPSVADLPAFIEKHLASHSGSSRN